MADSVTNAINGQIGSNLFKNARRVTFASPNHIEKKLRKHAEDDTCVVSPDLFEFSDSDLGGISTACSKVQSDLGCYSQKLIDPVQESIEMDIENTVKVDIQSILTNPFGLSAPVSSGVINISEVIAALISQESSKYVENEQQEDFVSILPDVDVKNLSVDELIQAHSKCHEHIDRLITEIQDSS